MAVSSLRGETSKRKGIGTRLARSRALRIATLAFSLFTLASLPASPVDSPSHLDRFEQAHAAMGTEFTLTLFAPDQQTADHVAAAAFDEIDRLEALLSNYRPSSELSRISRDAATQAVITDPETFRFLDRSLFWSRQSNGAFDITVGPLLRAWGFFFHNGRIPSSSELQRPAQQRIGWQKVLLKPRQPHRPVRQQASPLDLDPGQHRQGLRRRLASSPRSCASLGVTSALLSAGGSTLYAHRLTRRAAQGWPVIVPDPHHPGRLAATPPSCSKTFRSPPAPAPQKFFIRNGHRYCHSLQSLTRCVPVEGVLQTTVIDPSATDSDALSTIVFVLKSGGIHVALSSPLIPQTSVRSSSRQKPSTPSPALP